MSGAMHYEVTKGKDGDWYWHAIARNGKIVADGAEGYTRAADCRKALNRFVASVIFKGEA